MQSLGSAGGVRVGMVDVLLDSVAGYYTILR